MLCCDDVFFLQDKLLGLLFDESVMELALLVAGQVDARRFKEDAPLLLDLLSAVYDVSRGVVGAVVVFLVGGRGWLARFRWMRGASRRTPPPAGPVVCCV
jgi:hypothetical protein